jgi:hypothetical protein
VWREKKSSRCGSCMTGKGSSSHNSQDSEIAVGIYGVWAVAPIYQWNDFEQNIVRQQCNAAQRKLAHFPTSCASEHHTANEQLCCGNESCPSSIRSACLPSDDQYRDTAGIPCRFGDAKACDLGEVRLILSAWPILGLARWKRHDLADAMGVIPFCGQDGWVKSPWRQG